MGITTHQRSEDKMVDVSGQEVWAIHFNQRQELLLLQVEEFIGTRDQGLWHSW